MNGEPWFVGKDVSAILNYSNTRKALLDHVDAEDKTDGVTIRDSIGREQKPVIINESGLYSLILGSKLPSAKSFQRWVTSEVLPSIRKHGAYINGQESMTEMEIMARAILSAQKIIESKDVQIAEMKPKALFAWFRENNYLIKKRGSDYNMSTQRSMDMGLFWIHERVYEDEFGEPRLTRTVKVTGKGQNYFVNIFIKKREDEE